MMGAEKVVTVSEFKNYLCQPPLNCKKRLATVVSTENDCTILSCEHKYINNVEVVGQTVHGRKILGISFVRNPLAYIMSRINHDMYLSTVVRWKQYDASMGAVRCSTVEAWLAQNRSCTGFEAQDGQVSYFGGGSLIDARHSINSIFALGLTEYMEESFCLFAFQLGQIEERKCSCAYRHTYSSARSNHQQVQDESKHYDKDKIAKISTFIQLDMSLWDTAASRFFSELKYVENTVGYQILCKDNELAAQYQHDIRN